jgi:mRNA interferase RelE/StbE
MITVPALDADEYVCCLLPTDKLVATAVAEFLYGSLATSPHRVGKPLKLGLDGLHSARRGDYRVIYRIDDQRRLVTAIAIEHRSDIYRPRRL